MKTLLTHFFLVNFFLTNMVHAEREFNSPSFTVDRDTIDVIQVANEYTASHLSEWGLTSRDIFDMKISDLYTDQSSGITRIYFQQHYEGIPVHNAILNVNITKEGEVYFAASRFVQGLEGKINTTVPRLQPGEAVAKLATHLGLTPTPLRMKEGNFDSLFVFEKNDIALEEITAALSYQPDNGKVILSWDILFSPVNTHDTWSARIDAIDGHIIHKDNWTLYCKAGEHAYSHEEHDCTDQFQNIANDSRHAKPSSPITDDPTGAKYNVWPAPVESPAHGLRSIVTNPADTIASPYGWHDTNGQPGHEYTITRGNNCFSYQDRDDLGYSSGDEPDGGPELQFDPPYDPAWEPQHYIDASVVNLFYWINYLHDFSYHFGFDEASGNFQKNNYGRGGQGDDFVWAVAQSCANTDTLHNNAVYRHKNEGMAPSIFMFDYIELDRYLTIVEPVSVNGLYKTNVPSAGWGAGAYITDIPVTGEVVLVNDGVEEPLATDACQDILNASELAGKIALIDRGACSFSYKALKAQEAGAIGVIFCNTLDNKVFTLAAGPDAPQVNIPVVLITLRESETIRKFAGNGLVATLVNPGQIGLSVRLTTDFDAGLIGHEYGHGISLRLAGGPDKNCLDNEEQMGEGWSDFFGLVTTVQPGDHGEDKRGLGTYVTEEIKTGNGIRRFPYSTDMSASPLTYGDVASSQERHDLGEVWAMMLWDMYWALSDKYGWSEDLYDQTSGNYKAVRLVIDGLKNMACDPGFVDGRDAILAADSVLYNGENQCLLWEVFARRGLGYSADQGSPYDAGDQVEAFDLPPLCTGKILIEKSVTDFIQAGEDIQVSIKVGNYKNETASNVIVKDIIPEGTTFKLNSSNYPAVKEGKKLSFDLGNMNISEENIITYTLQTSSGNWSQRKFMDDVPDENNVYWLSHNFGSTAPNLWALTDSSTAHTGNFIWITQEIPDKSQQALILNPDAYTFHVGGQLPALRFYHRYKTKAGTNGGVVEVREAGNESWKSVSPYILRNGYTGTIDYRTFVAAHVEAFSGNSGDEFQATYIDLSPWMGKDIQIRFRFGTFTNTHQGLGWMIDDIEFMDLIAYDEEVCVTTDQGDFECDTAPESGTIVDSKEEQVSTDPPISQINSRIYPNPATDAVTIALSTDQKMKVNISLLTMEGKLLFMEAFDVLGNDYLNINTSTLPAGVYLIKMSSGQNHFTERLIIQKT